jgi:hypothetical protein
MSSTKRALIAVGVMVCTLGVVAAVYLYRMHRPLAGTSTGPAPSILAELPSDAPAVAYLDVAALRKLQNSPLSAVLDLTKNGSQTDREYADFVRDTGFDYTQDLDQAAIAFWPTSLAAATNAAGDDPALAIADGRFDQHKIEAYAMRVGGRTEQHGNRKIYVVPGSPVVSFEFLSPTRIAIASGKKSADLVDISTGGQQDAAMQTRINRVAGAPIFAVVRTSSLPASFYADLAKAPELDHLVRSLQGLSLSGQPQGDQIHVALDAECDSMKNAFEMSTILDGFRLIGSMSLSDPKTRRQLQMTPEQAALLKDLIKAAHVSTQDRWVRISLDLTPEMLGESAQPNSSHAPTGTR